MNKPRHTFSISVTPDEMKLIEKLKKLKYTKVSIFRHGLEWLERVTQKTK